MLPPQLMGGPPDPSQQGPPPELLQALMSGVGAGGPQGPPPDQGPPQQQGGSAVDHLRQAIEHAQAALQLEPNDADSQNLAKVVQGLYAILAQRQKEEQQVLGNPATQRVVSRASG